MIWIEMLWEFAKKVPNWAWAALGLTVCLMVARAHYIDVGEDRVQARWDAQEALHAAQAKKAAEDAANTEKRQQAANAAALATLQQENKDAQRRLNNDIAALRTGNLKLRESLRAPRCGVSEAPAGAGGSDDPGVAYVSREGQEFFLRLGADADRVVRKLTACQAILSAERE